MTISAYQSVDVFDEMFAPNGQPRPGGVTFVERMRALSDGELQKRQKAAELSLQNMGITFTVYGHEAGTEKVWHLVERADKTSRILLPDTDDVGSVLDVVRWSALLKSASALAMYRRQYGKIIPKNVADLSILDRQFPRSMHFLPHEGSGVIALHYRKHAGHISQSCRAANGSIVLVDGL